MSFRTAPGDRHANSRLTVRKPSAPAAHKAVGPGCVNRCGRRDSPRTLVCTLITVPTRSSRIMSLLICLSNLLFASDLTPPQLSRVGVLRGNRQARLCQGGCAFRKAISLFVIYCLLTLPLRHRGISFYGECEDSARAASIQSAGANTSLSVASNVETTGALDR